MKDPDERRADRVLLLLLAGCLALLIALFIVLLAVLGYLPFELERV